MQLERWDRKEAWELGELSIVISKEVTFLAGFLLHAGTLLL